MNGGRGMVGFKVGLRVLVVFALAASVAGCSGKSEAGGDESDGGGGTGGTGAGGTGASGTGGTTGGAGGTAGVAGTGGSTQPSKLGLYLLIRNPSAAEVAGKQCPASSGIEWDIGAAILSNGMVVDVDSPTPTDSGTTLEDGEEDTQIQCAVTPSGMINAEGGGTDPMITPPNGLVNFTLTATASLRGGVNVQGFSLYTPITLMLQTAAGFPPCAMSDLHEVAPGAFWGDLDCPALVDPSRPDVACHASGTIVLEYCATQ